MLKAKPFRVKIAVIGAGLWGPNLIRSFHTHPESTVTWVSDLDTVRLNALKENYDGISVTSDWVIAVTQPEVDAVVISTPTTSHYSIAKRALLEGKHVFVEKPLATTYPEAIELTELAESRGLKLMVGHVFLFNPAIHRVKEILDRGELGKILYLYSIRTNLGPIRADVNALWDLAPHDISILFHLLDERPNSVRASGSSFINPPVEDVAFATLTYPSGILASLHVSWLDPKKVRQLVIVGSEKMLVFDDMAPSESVRIFDKNVGTALSASLINDTLHHFRQSIVEGKVTIPEIPSGEPLKNECHAFVASILRDEPHPSTGRLGADVVKLLERISFSIQRQGTAADVFFSPAVSGDTVSKREPELFT